ncbi:C39 family peptidase [Paenibacillus sp. CC-CFT747]|nr:C39 family peptidase [Paenibacillus sp. CC-CFT747]
MDVPLINQNPELKYGCEVTSLAMVLKYAGMETDKMKLANELPKDTDPLKKTDSGNITSWGNPDHGFVGDVTGKTPGYAIYAGPLEKVMQRYLPNRTVNLTRRPFDEILGQLSKEKPVILWTTGDYKVPDRWESWTHGNEKINTPLDLHAVVLVGFDKDYLYLNDPLAGKKSKRRKRILFWNHGPRWDSRRFRIINFFPA